MQIEKNFDFEEGSNDMRISCSGVFFVDLTSKVLRFTWDKEMSDGEIQQSNWASNLSLYTFKLVSKVISSKYDRVEMRGEG